MNDSHQLLLLEATQLDLGKRAGLPGRAVWLQIDSSKHLLSTYIELTTETRPPQGMKQSLPIGSSLVMTGTSKQFLDSECQVRINATQRKLEKRTEQPQEEPLSTVGELYGGGAY